MSRLDATAGAALIADALLRAGVTEVIVAPGSRSTPLVAAVAGHPHLRTLIVHDERSGAFVALGVARATGRPAALVTTSGTAVANAMPAVVEADVDRVPLVIVTADRPPESLGTDANQTIDQRGFFGTRARASLDLPPPEDCPDADALVIALDAALSLATRTPRGPVHLNAAYRKPLEPVATSCPATFSDPREPEVTVLRDSASRDDLDAALRSARRPVLIVGAAADDHDRAALCVTSTFMAHLGVPVLSCVLSGVRGPASPGVISHGPLLAKAGLLDDVDPDLVLWLGGAAVAPEFGALAARAAQLWRIDDRDRRPLEHGSPRVVRTSLTGVALALPAVLDPREPDPLIARDRAADGVVRTLHPPGPPLDEPRVAVLAALGASLTKATLFLGNSMPVRDADLFAGAVLPKRVVANRGASGIDGILSTAAGVARAAGPTLLLVGDVSFLHDAGSLSALASARVPLRVVAVDNRGGGIFDLLPISRHAELMPYFTTRHEVDLVALARAYRVPARRFTTQQALLERLKKPIRRLEVLVVPVPPAGPGNPAVAGRRELYGRVREAAGGPS